MDIPQCEGLKYGCKMLILWYMSMTGVLILQVCVAMTQGCSAINLARETIGVIANLCPNVSICVNITELRTVYFNNTNITTTLHWKYIDSQELYQVARTVSEFKHMGITSCLIATDLDFPYVQPIFAYANMTFVHVGVVSPNVPESKPKVTLDCSWDYGNALATSRSVCRPPPGYTGKVLQQKLAPNTGHMATIVTTMLTHVQWDEVMILYESIMDAEIEEICHILLDNSILYNSSVIDNFSMDNYHSLISKAANWEQSRRIRILILCTTKCHQFLSAMDAYDQVHLRTSALRHFSEVILVHVSDGELPSTYHLNSTIDNMDFEVMMHSIINDIKKSASGSKDSMSSQVLTHIESIQGSKTCDWIPISTLMWTAAGPRGLQLVGFIDRDGSMFVLSPFFPNKEFGLNGRNFLVATLQWWPFVMKSDNGTYEGLCFDIFNEIAARFNFTYDVMEPTDGEWGLELDNGSWSGVVGMLQRKEVDLVVASLNVHSRREEVIDFTYPYFYDSTIILMTKEDPMKTKWRTLIDPFDDTVLLLIGCALVAISFLLCVFERLSPYYCDETSYLEQKSLKSFQDSFWYLYGALLTQGGDRLPHSQTGRTLLSCWWLFCLVMMASYSGNLIAYLTVSKDKLPFNTLHEMLNQDQYKWGLIGGSYWVTIFKHSVLSDFKRVWQGVEMFNETDPSVLSTDPDVHIRKVIDGNYAYLGDKTQIEIKMANECTLQTGRDEVLPFQYAFGLPNHSPFTDMLSGVIIEIHESGLINIWKSRRWPHNNLCSGDVMTTAKIITLVDVQSAFYLIGIGLTLASLVMGLEKARACCRIRLQDRKEEKEKQKEQQVNGT